MIFFNDGGTMMLKAMFFLGTLFLACNSYAEDPITLNTQKDKVNYAIGVNLVNNLKQQGVEVDQNLVMKGMRDAFGGGELLLSDDELRKSISQYMKTVRQKQGLAAKTRMTAAEENKKTGEAFLTENKKKAGIVTTPSGLQYRIIKEGTGLKPTGGDTVECNYRGTLINGKEFDSSSRLGKPGVFKVKDGVVPGWSEALRLMPVGSKWQLFIPHTLGYGERGRGKDVGPNETLIIEVELVGIK
jgi:FKBP-type peptidyl-prolyl cis-trans isomerase FklB